MQSNDPPDFNLDQQIWHDLSKRTWVGIFLLPILWLMIGFWSKLHISSPVFFSINGLIVLVSALIRLYWIHFLKSNNYRQNIKTLSYMILFSGFHWGLLFACLLFTIDYSVTQHYTTVLILIGLTVTATATFNVFDYLGIQYPIVSLAPSVIGAILLKTDHYLFFTFLSIIVLIYSYTHSKAAKKAYLQSLSQHDALTKEAQSALKLSRTDYLTQLGNRFYFMDQYEQSWQKSLDTQTPLSLIFANVNFLTEINQEFGHQTGDTLIQQIATALSPVIKAPNVLSRYGGGEFAIALPNIDFEVAAKIANNIQASIKEVDFQHNGQPLPCSCSLSVVSTIADVKDDPAALIEKARQSLHKAKLQTSASWSTFKTLRVFDMNKDIDHSNE